MVAQGADYPPEAPEEDEDEARKARTSPSSAAPAVRASRSDQCPTRPIPRRAGRPRHPHPRPDPGRPDPARRRAATVDAYVIPLLARLNAEHITHHVDAEGNVTELDDPDAIPAKAVEAVAILLAENARQASAFPA